jgi:hypothetical protein
MEKPIEISGNEVLTQIGLKRREARKGFRCRPRSHESSMSLLLGEWDSDWAVRTAFGREPTREDAVRHGTAACLTEAGFRVIHNQFPYPAHVSVEFGGKWTEALCEAFHRCFEGE